MTTRASFRGTPGFSSAGCENTSTVAESGPEQFARQALPHLGVLHAAAQRYAKRDRAAAEDLVQETLLRALISWERFRPGTDCRAWLLKILTNSFINGYRRKTRQRRLAQNEELLFCPRRRRAAHQPEATLMESMLADEVIAALESLPDEFVEAVALADLAGMSYREVAARIGCPIGTVMSRLHRARKLLAEQLTDYAREQGITRDAA
jgi:RNA polymerase sigma-70 factor (ECF subfamily)